MQQSRGSRLPVTTGHTLQVFQCSVLWGQLASKGGVPPLCHLSSFRWNSARRSASTVTCQMPSVHPNSSRQSPECLTGKNLACVQVACKSQHKNCQFKVTATLHKSFVGFELCKEDSMVKTSGRMGYKSSKSSKHLAT